MLKGSFNSKKSFKSTDCLQNVIQTNISANTNANYNRIVMSGPNRS